MLLNKKIIKGLLLLILTVITVSFMVNAVAPVMNSSRISPIIAYTDNDLIGYCNATDSDGDDLSYYYKWFRKLNGFCEQQFSENTTGCGSVAKTSPYTTTSSLSVVGSASDTYDGDWLTNWNSAQSGGYVRLETIYEIPEGATENSLWESKVFGNLGATDQRANVTLDSSCWDNIDGLLKVRLTGYALKNVSGQCYNGTDWIGNYNYRASTLGQAGIYEEKMHWEIYETYEQNQTIDYCYQESVNVTNQTNLDGSCGINYNGSIISSQTSEYIYFNYSKPNETVYEVIWEYKIGQQDTQNYTLDTDCLNYSNNNLMLRVKSLNGASSIQCYNGTDWKILNSYSGTDFGGFFDQKQYFKAYDGDWDTGGYYTTSLNGWNNELQTPLDGAMVWEEGIYWGTYYQESDEQLISTLDSSNTLKNQNWTFQCIAYDGTTNSTPLNSTLLTIMNTPPTFNQSLFTWTINHYQNDTLILNASDSDSDTITFLENSTLLTINTTSGELSYLGSNDISRYGIHNISINVSDGSNTTTTSFLLNLTNTAPSVTLVTILPTAGNSTDNLTFSNTTIDAENNNITDWSYIWYNNSIRISILDNKTSVNSSYTSSNDSWIVELQAYDGIDWSIRTNSTVYTIGDNIKPILINDELSSSSGVDDTPFIIYVNVSEENFISSIKVEINDTNDIKTNFSMSLLNGSSNNGRYSVQYTPGTDGIYKINKFYAIDGSGNIGTLLSNLTYTESTTPTTPSGGGGGGTTSAKKVCDLEFEPGEITIIGRSTETIIIKNFDDVSFTPNPVIPDELKDNILFTIPTSIIFTGQEGQLNFVNTNADLSGEGTIIITSDNCEDITLDINVKPPTVVNVAIGFFDDTLFEVAGVKINNMILFGLSLFLGIIIVIPRKNLERGQKFFGLISIIGIVMLIFNLIF